ncbi:hypothetical protein [Kamptonema formosum]|uniref:hypothetical protein n=1 Tax=Kamptonema formosum TaxID=331992 RepID=UPI0003468144|nr:hypothetical protein [Oscillatoria sp. PCC 10802]
MLKSWGLPARPTGSPRFRANQNRTRVPSGMPKYSYSARGEIFPARLAVLTGRK